MWRTKNQGNSRYCEFEAIHRLGVIVECRIGMMSLLWAQEGGYWKIIAIRIEDIVNDCFEAERVGRSL